MLRLTRISRLMRPVREGDRPKAVHPLITRGRTWRGVMQVRGITPGQNGPTTSTLKLLLLALTAPLRVALVCLCGASCYYFLVGHDQFMFEVMGYQSEMQYETTVNPLPKDPTQGFETTFRGAAMPVRALEKPLHPVPVFENQLKH